MSDHEARGMALYDHDNEEPRPSGRRRRQVADWGVGEEMFDHLPGRRFERRQHRDIPRGDAADGRRTIVIETDDAPPTREISRVSGGEFTSRDDALRARERDDELWDGDEPFAAPEAEAEVEAPEAEEAPVEDRWAAADAWAARADAAEAAAAAPEAPEEIAQPQAHEPDEASVVRGSQTGRRTVKIGGRPAEWHGASSAARRRPPRTVHERLGPRPERIAAWAFALGLLLILIAIATSSV